MSDAPVWTGVSRGECERYVDHAVSKDPTVKFLFQRLDQAGCSTDKSFITFEECTEEAGGGFRPPDGVVMCYNHLGSQEEVNLALAHELIHAYDHCRGANISWQNCEHHACSEVRAANLSGDCRFRQELLRGHLNLRGQHRICARRRAELSVAMNPFCKGLKGKVAVDKVFEPCFQDTAPFDRIP